MTAVLGLMWFIVNINFQQTSKDCMFHVHSATHKCLLNDLTNKMNTLTTRNALREHKSPPIRRIQISDFGLPHPKRDPDRHQNCITWSLSHALPLQKISSKSVHKFASNSTDRQTNRQTDKQTNRQTDRTKNITSFFGGGANMHFTKADDKMPYWTYRMQLQCSIKIAISQKRLTILQKIWD